MSAMRQPRHVVARPSMSVYPDVMSVIVVSESLPRDPLTALRVVTESEHELDRIRRTQVIAARAAGASWQQIGDALGVSRQSVWESFTAETRAALASNADANSMPAEDKAVRTGGRRGSSCAPWPSPPGELTGSAVVLVVIDANVFVSAAIQRGASHRIIAS